MGAVAVEFAGRNFFIAEADGRDQVANAIRTGAYESPLPILVIEMMARLDGAFLDVGAGLPNTASPTVKLELAVGIEAAFMLPLPHSKAA